MTSSGDHLRGLAPGQNSLEETSQQWLAGGHTVFNFMGPGMEHQTSRSDSDELN